MACNQIKLSVREIVEFALKTGSLDDTFVGKSRAVQGTRAHQKLQKQRLLEFGDSYICELSLGISEEREGLSFLIEGRADGILLRKQGVAIEEIKSTYCPLELIDYDFNSMHWAQAKVYGYIYSVQNNIESIEVQLTYYNLDSEEHKTLSKDYAREELESFFESLLQKLCSWYAFIYANAVRRDKSIAELQFPFASYRKNQRELAVAVYKTIMEGNSIFVQAPTGTGKTISTIFPAIKAMGEGHISKLFYLTAKTITGQVAENTLKQLLMQGLELKAAVITAKDKICFEPDSSCKAELCPYAEGYFDRIDEAVKDIISNENLLSRALIEAYAQKHVVCPFEFSLDISLWADIIICDYNYVFDPRAFLKRYFGDSSDKEAGGSQYALLIDEAHNLVDRSRAMHTAEISKSAVLEQKRYFKSISKGLYKTLTALNKYFIDYKKVMEGKAVVSKELPKELCKLLRKLAADFEEQLQHNGAAMNEQALQLYFDVMFFLKISELFDENFVCIVENNRDLNTKLFCIDASQLIMSKLQQARAAVFFSATLLPMEYYVDLLGGTENSYKMKIPSSFPRENLGLCVATGISTRYKDRQSSVSAVAELIDTAVGQKKGNYLVFCSSYAYMQDILSVFREYNRDYDIFVQEQAMSDALKEEFISNFQEERERTMISFAVMGGMFSEGIDLVGDRLSGAIIVGVGLPQLCLERDIIKEYFDSQKGTGFDYAYKYPGMNKVQQAAGRVIRTEGDRGIVVLIDDRFEQQSYKRLYPKEWEGHAVTSSRFMLERFIKDFWK